MNKNIYNLVKDNKFLVVLILLYLFVNVIGICMLFTHYNFKNDEVGKYLPMVKSLAYENAIYGQYKTSIFYPAVLSLSQVFNKVFGYTSPENIILTIKIMHIIIVNLAFIYLYKLGTTLFDKRVALASASYLTLMSYWLTENRHLLFDTVSATFIIIATYYLLKGINEDKNLNFVLAGIFLMFGFMSKFTVGIFGLSFLSIIFFSGKKRNKILKYSLILCATAFIIFVIYGLLDLITMGGFAKSLFNTFEQDFRIKVATSKSEISSYIIPLNYYFKSLFAFIFPLSIFFAYGSIKVFIKNKIRFFSLLLLICPFFLLMELFKWKESRYIIPIVPFIIMLGFYGLACFIDKVFAREKGPSKFLEIGIIGSLSIISIFLVDKIIKNGFITRLNYDPMVKEFSNINVTLIQISFLLVVLLIVISLILIFYKYDIYKKKNILFLIITGVIILSVMPLQTFGELTSKNKQVSCYDLAKEFKTEIKSTGITEYKLVSVTPCNMPEFLNENYVMLSQPFLGSLYYPQGLIEVIAKNDYILCPKEEAKYFNTQLMILGKEAKSFMTKGDYAVYKIELNSLDYKIKRFIPIDDYTGNHIHREYDYVVFYHGNDSLFKTFNLERSTYLLTFEMKGDNPPPVGLHFYINEKLSEDLVLKDNVTIWKKFEINLGTLEGPTTLKWVFYDDIAKNIGNKYVEDRNAYLNNIKLLEVEQ